MKKLFLCLAKSAREGGLCIAGKEIKDSKICGWFRPVGSEHESIPSNEFPFKIGDIVQCEIESPSPEPTQPENFILNNNAHWRKIDTLSEDQKKLLCLLCEDTPINLWGTGYHTKYGLNDKIPEYLAEGCKNSLYLIKAKKCTIYKCNQSYNPEEPRFRIRLRFYYNNNMYDMVVTDSSLSLPYWNTLAAEDEVVLNDFYITVSLGKPFHGDCYKLVAGHVFI